MFEVQDLYFLERKSLVRTGIWAGLAFSYIPICRSRFLNVAFVFDNVFILGQGVLSEVY